MNNIFTPSLPEQVAQNTIAIEQLRQLFNNASADIDMQDNTTVISATHITPTLTEGFILDTVGHLYKIVSYDEDTQLYTVRYLTDLTTTGPQGPQGVGIASITLTSSAGLVDTYTITYTDSTTSTFTVTNGAQGPTGNGISTITLTSSAGLVDTYTITFTDGTTTTFTVTNGAQGNPGPTGNGISSITKTGTSGNVDTYTILYTNGTTTTFTVTNGSGALVTNTVSTVNDIINYVRFNYDKTIKVRLNLANTGISATVHKFNMSTQTYTTSVETIYPGNPILTLTGIPTSGAKFIGSGMYSDPVTYYISNGHIYMYKSSIYYNDVVSYYEDIDITSLFTSADIIYFS